MLIILDLAATNDFFLRVLLYLRIRVIQLGAALSPKKLA